MDVYLCRAQEGRKQARRINLSISSESRRSGSTEEEDGEQGARKEARA